MGEIANGQLYPDYVWAAADRLAEKVAPIYLMTDWKWYGTMDGEVPEVRHIRKQLLDLYCQIKKDSEIDRAETGGLFCEVDDEDVYTFGFELTEIIPEEE